MRCLILGYGYMGKIRYSELRCHPSVSNVSIYDPYLDAAASGLNGQLLPANRQIDWSRFDAAFVCTPNNVTADYCVEALRNCGKVFCEKPPGRNWDDFCRIADAAQEDPGRVLVFGFNHRLHPSILAACSLLNKGHLGELMYIKGSYGKSGGTKHRQSWRNDKKVSGGGILLDQGIHMLDLFHLFAGPLTMVDAVLVDSFWDCGVEDNAFVLLKSNTGVPLFLHSSATLWKHTFRIEIGCKNGYLLINGLLSKTGSYGREQLVIGKREFEDEAMALGNPREEIIHFDRDESWHEEINEFLNAIKEKRTPVHGTLEQARRAMRLVSDVYERRGIAKLECAV